MLLSGLLQERHSFGSFSQLCMCAGQAVAGELDQNRLLLQAQPLLGSTNTVSSPSLCMLPPPLHPLGSSLLHQVQQGRRECSLGSGLLF